ncbi:MAG TPA: hypothetical protein VLA68_07075 [Nitrososphaera sp.]|nr:hypothetical protein [Nitrososphaera sp.]
MCQGIKVRDAAYDALKRAMILGAGVAAALALYLSLTLYVFPQSYQSIGPRRPEAVVTAVNISASEIELGQAFVVSANGVNMGEDADAQIVSIGFPNLTATRNIEVIRHDFLQSPQFIIPGEDEVGTEYTGESLAVAQYPSVEAFSRPWEGGDAYSIDVQVRPEAEGRFAIFVKSVAFPHSWDGAHWPQEGTVDYQKEFAQVHYVTVTKP